MDSIVTTGVDAVGSVETRGVETIPEIERHSSPSNIAKMLVGAQFAFSIILFGWLPITLGLDFWGTVAAILIGTAVGCLPFCPMGLYGQRSGTNGAVASGAHFGVVGRLLGSLLGLFSALGFVSLTVWTSGDAVVAGIDEFFGTTTGDFGRGLAYAVVILILVAIAAFGHANMVAAQKIMIPVVGIMMLIGLIAVGSKIDVGYEGGDYALGSYWSTWAAAAVIFASVPISMAPFGSDWGRYVSPYRFSQRSMMVGYAGGAYVGLCLAYLFGALTATAMADPTGDYVTGFATASPSWYVPFIVLIGLMGGFAQGSFGLYGMGLDFSSVIPGLRRVPATLILGIICGVIVYVGTFVFNAVDSINAFLAILLLITTPWIAVMIIGYISRRGHYKSEDLQVWNRRQTGGAYWFTGGINLRAFGAWIPAVIIGLLFLNTTFFTGPLAGVAEGVDLSWIVAGVCGAVFYVAALKLFPEPAELSAPSFEMIPHPEPAELV